MKYPANKLAGSLEFTFDMDLQVYVDETGIGSDAICAIVGLASTPYRWIALTKEWNAECSKQPATPDFHMIDAWNPFGAYWGRRRSRVHPGDKDLSREELTKRRDTRLAELRNIIKRYAMFVFQGWMVPFLRTA